MNKPNAYDETQAGGGFTPVELGGHKLVIKQVIETKSRNGKDMIVIKFDFAEGDKQAGYFEEQFKNDIRPDKDWPYQATQYTLINNPEGKCSRDFKTFITCVEHSNAGFETKWGNEIQNWPSQFQGKKIGGVFGEQMDYYNGEEKKKRVLRWFCSLDKVADAAVPDMSETKPYKDWKNSQSGTDWMNVPNNLDDDSLPFN